MAVLNRATLKQKISDFINRVAPFDGNPLIQKTEDNEIRDDVADSAVLKIPTTGSNNNPSANFSLDFTTNDEWQVDTSGSATSAFTITLANLQGNSTGKISITKKSGDTFSFANAVALPYGVLDGQDGKITIAFSVSIVNGTYFIYPLYERAARIKIDGGLRLNTKIVEIGDWDMSSLNFLQVAHGLSDFTKIRSVKVVVRNDANTNLYDLIRISYLNFTKEYEGGSVQTIDTNNIVLGLIQNSLFDNANFSTTGGYNRGWVTILYEE